MGDIFVHMRMKECCRTTLKDLDKRKGKAKFKDGLLGTRSLAEAFGEKTIDDAKKALVGGGAASGGEMERLTRAACAKVCEKHAGVHEAKGEMEEGGFWREVVGAITRVPRSSVTPSSLSPLKYAVAASDPATAMQVVTDAKKAALKKAADVAKATYPDACNKSTASVATALGYNQLEGKKANPQIDYMAANWDMVDAKTAQDKANAGELVVAGLKGGEHGHTIVVVPGSGETKDGKFYPNVEGGAMDPDGASNGTKTAGDVWRSAKRDNVKYYTPKQP